MNSEQTAVYRLTFPSDIITTTKTLTQNNLSISSQLFEFFCYRLNTANKCMRCTIIWMNECRWRISKELIDFSFEQIFVCNAVQFRTDLREREQQFFNEDNFQSWRNINDITKSTDFFHLLITHQIQKKRTRQNVAQTNSNIAFDCLCCISSTRIG